METYFKSTSQVEDVLIHPRDLSRLSECVRDKIRERIGKCTKEDGFVCEVSNIRIMQENTISRITGHVIFKVNYTYTSLKPEKDHIYPAKIIHVFDEGVFCEYQYIRIFVPHSSKTFQVGDTISIRIQNIRFEDKQYQCIGHYLESV